MTAAETGEKYSLRSVTRALDILEALAAGNSAGMGVGDIAVAIGVSRSTAFTLLQTLVARGLVSDSRTGSSRVYRLGLTLIRLGDLAASELGITQIATPVLQQLVETTQLTARLAVLDDGYAVAIGRVDAPGPFKVSASLGRRELPHCSAVGKALLMRLPTEQIMAILTRLGMPRRTDQTITSQGDLIADLRQAAARGYAFDDEEDNVGVVCVGAAVYDRTGAAIAGVSVTSLKLGKSENDLHQLGFVVRSYADRISQMLGGPSFDRLPPLS